MKLIYTNTGEEVKVGDVAGDEYRVDFFREPHKPSSSGKVSVTHIEDGFSREFFVGVIGAEWVDREDR